MSVRRKIDEAGSPVGSSATTQCAESKADVEMGRALLAPETISMAIHRSPEMSRVTSKMSSRARAASPAPRD